MSPDPKPTTFAINGRLWGTRTDDWANIQEGMCRPLYEAVLSRTNVGAATTYLSARGASTAPAGPAARRAGPVRAVG